MTPAAVATVIASIVRVAESPIAITIVRAIAISPIAWPIVRISTCAPAEGKH
jgi:hypothetical protein